MTPNKITPEEREEKLLMEKYQAAYKLGQQQGMEAAAKICDEEAKYYENNMGEDSEHIWSDAALQARSNACLDNAEAIRQAAKEIK